MLDNGFDHWLLKNNIHPNITSNNIDNSYVSINKRYNNDNEYIFKDYYEFKTYNNIFKNKKDLINLKYNSQSELYFNNNNL